MAPTGPGTAPPPPRATASLPSCGTTAVRRWPRRSLERRPLRADWAGHTLVQLLRIDWKGYRADRDVLGAGYRWFPPEVAALAEAPRAQAQPGPAAH